MLMKLTPMKISAILGWVFVSLLAVLLFPDKELAQKAETPYLGEVSARTLIAPISFEVPKTEQELEVERQKASEKVNAVFEFNPDETEKILKTLKQFLSKINTYGILKQNRSEERRVGKERK